MTNSLVAISLLKPNHLAVLWISILTLPKYLTFPFKKSRGTNNSFAHVLFLNTVNSQIHVVENIREQSGPYGQPPDLQNRVTTTSSNESNREVGSSLTAA
jgi:hypothetical protein